MKKYTITVNNVEISCIKNNESDYISLTDMVKNFGDDAMIYSWMRNRNTVEFLWLWEQMHNPDFKCNEIVTFKTQAGLNNLTLLAVDSSIKAIEDKNRENGGKRT